MFLITFFINKEINIRRLFTIEDLRIYEQMYALEVKYKLKTHLWSPGIYTEIQADTVCIVRLYIGLEVMSSDENQCHSSLVIGRVGK